ncbi:FAD-binding oxidoreductase [Aquabacterium soli]|uniref:FAD-binding oxidoreductase n=1 Tax=Aquabacterium soli TaxID=2493092 RepID=A0A426VGL9_9BURK|nr:FAD-binding oxidoreductase [Aquabacterium soli]RRS05870.1 FAD-binding oxidoreductase [Aquabacterium soli]
MNRTAWLDDLGALLGPTGLLRPDQGLSANDREPFELDWRRRYRGQALAIARPDSVAQVQAVVRACAAHGVALIPQGGNTGLVGGSIPDTSGRQLLLNLTRLKQVRAVDPANLSLTADAGCTLAQVQQAAQDHGLLFPLSLASEGSCTIGGNLATNAGGTQVLRYGTARELCLGLEVVTASGTLWSSLSGLRKDNTGYDLRGLLIGSEGTLGVITAATLRLYPRPRGQATALAACNSLADAVALLSRARGLLDAGLTAFEAMGALPLDLVARHHPDISRCTDALRNQGHAPPWTVLIEHASPDSQDHADQRLQALLAGALEAGEISNASLAASDTQRKAIWQLRETIPLAERTEGLMVKHDIAVPTSAIPAFVEQAGQQLQARWPDSRVVCFGHLGDGNLHYNVQPPAGQSQGEALLAFEYQANQVVFDLVDRFGGTLSAEHGIGQLRCDELARRKPPEALAMMRSIKQALDPQGLFNPGRVLRPHDEP